MAQHGSQENVAARRPVSAALRPRTQGPRAQIDAVDEKIHALINDRARLAQLGRHLQARRRQDRRFLPSRARSAGAAHGAGANKGPLRDEEILRLFREIMSACLAQQEPLKVALPGAGGHVYAGGGAQALRPFRARPAAAIHRRSVPRGRGRPAPTSASCRSRIPPKARSITRWTAFSARRSRSAAKSSCASTSSSWG